MRQVFRNLDLRYRLWFIRFCNIIWNNLGAEYENSQDDVVVIMVEIKNGSGLTWKKEHVIECDDKFSAMQKCTAFPISTMASMMADGIFDKRKEERREGKEMKV